MLELINAIPENVGWTMVGFLMAVCAFAFVVLVKTFIDMWREHKEVGEED